MPGDGIHSLRAELGALTHTGWEIKVNEFVPDGIPSMAIDVAKSGMSGPLMDQFLSWHSWLILRWELSVPQAAWHHGHGAPATRASS